MGTGSEPPQMLKLRKNAAGSVPVPFFHAGEGLYETEVYPTPPTLTPTLSQREREHVIRTTPVRRGRILQLSTKREPRLCLNRKY